MERIRNQQPEEILKIKKANIKGSITNFSQCIRDKPNWGKRKRSKTHLKQNLSSFCPQFISFQMHTDPKKLNENPARK